MKNIRVHYTAAGWIVDTPIGLTPLQLSRVVQFHKNVQTERISVMRGDRREAGIKAMRELSVATIRQNVLPNDWKEHILIGER
jgi:hypothetical protein